MDALGQLSGSGPPVSYAAVWDFLCFLSTMFQEWKFIQYINKQFGNTNTNMLVLSK